MKTHGTIIRWNDERGFGFVRAANNELDIFAHISEFPKDGIRPYIGEMISFEIEKTAENKSKAVRIGRAITQHKQRHANPSLRSIQTKKSTRSYLGLALAVLVSLGFWLYSVMHSQTPASYAPVHAAPTPQSGNFKCDGRTLCSQMSSCSEAIYFLQNCPNTQMDGNNDGEPCEQQWCE